MDHHSSTNAPGALRPLTRPGAAMVGAAERFAVEFADGALATIERATSPSSMSRSSAPIASSSPRSRQRSAAVGSSRSAMCSSPHPGSPVATPPRRSVSTCTSPSCSTQCAAGGSPCPGCRRPGVGRGEEAARIVEGDVVFASAVSEAAPQDLTRPRTTAHRHGDGWVVPRAQGVRHDGAGGDDPRHGGDLRRQGRHRSLRFAFARGTRPELTSTTTGTLWGCVCQRPVR